MTTTISTASPASSPQFSATTLPHSRNPSTTSLPALSSLRLETTLPKPTTNATPISPMTALTMRLTAAAAPPTPPSPAKLYRIAPVPRRGLGLISTSRIDPHICIVNEPPLLKSSTDSLTEAFLTATPEDIATFYTLPNKHHLWSPPPRPSTLESQLWDTNVVSDLEGRTAVFAISSRVNHDCQPNAVLAMYADREVVPGVPGEEVEVPDEGEITKAKVVARRVIEVGEEITVDYLMGEGEGRDVEWRRERLARDWGFWCGCKRCVMEAKWVERRGAWLRLMEEEERERRRAAEEERRQHGLRLAGEREREERESEGREEDEESEGRGSGVHTPRSDGSGRVIHV